MIGSRQPGPTHQLSVLNGATGRPSVLYRSPFTQSLYAYRTATGAFTLSDNNATPFETIRALAGKNLLSPPASSKASIGFPKELNPLGALSRPMVTVSFETFIDR